MKKLQFAIINLRFTIFMLALCALFTSCGNDFEYSSPYACYFRFDNKLHQNGLMAAALTPYSNVFARVSTKKSGGINYVTISTSDSKPAEDVAITTEVENYSNFELGANNGIIVGYNTINNCYVAFDAQCRNCYEDAGAYTPNRTLSWTTNTSEVKCATCGRTYNLNMDGIVTSSEGGLQLWKYHISCTGQYGLLTVTR